MDRVLEHSLTYALIEIGDRVQTAAGLKHQSPRVRKQTLIALGQLKDGLTAERAAAELSSPDPAVPLAVGGAEADHGGDRGEERGVVVEQVGGDEPRDPRSDRALADLPPLRAQPGEARPHRGASARHRLPQLGRCAPCYASTC